jgi:hypothetical protein
MSWRKFAATSASRRSATAARSTRWPPGCSILVFGQATKLSEKLMSSDKVYEGVMRLGESTDSHDADGEITGSLPVPPLDLPDLNEAAATFRRRPVSRCRRW